MLPPRAFLLACLPLFALPRSVPDAVAQGGRNILQPRSWDLAPLVAGDSGWEADRRYLLREIETVEEVRASLRLGPGSLARGLDRIAELRTRAAKLAQYGLLQAEIDNQSAKARALRESGADLEARVEAAVAFVGHEIAALDSTTLERWLRETPALRRHERRVRQLRARAPHLLGLEAEAVAATFENQVRELVGVRQSLITTDLGWPTIRRADSSTIRLDYPAYLTLRRSSNAVERRAAVNGFLERVGRYEQTFADLLVRRIGGDAALARLRHFDKGPDADWFLRDGMPPGSFAQMIRSVRDQLSVARRFARLHRRILGQSTLSYADLSVLPGNSPDPGTVDQVLQHAVALAAPLGADYQARLRARLGQPLFHLEPAENKNPTFGVFPSLGSAPPYLLMSYGGTYASARLLTSGLFLLMSYADIPADRRPEDRRDPPIYSNAILYAAEMLYDDDWLAAVSGRELRIAVLRQALGRIWRQLVHHVMVAEHMLWIEQRIRDGRPPSGTEISSAWSGFVNEYYGTGLIETSPPEDREWIVETVPFLSWESTYWPPAMAAAALLVERLRAGDSAARRVMAEALGRGPSDSSHDLFRAAGISLDSPEPYHAATRRMIRLMDQLENLLGS